MSNLATPTATLYGQVRICWIKRRGYARIPDHSIMR
jgi:hypothetical protein